MYFMIKFSRIYLIHPIDLNCEVLIVWNSVLIAAVRLLLGSLSRTKNAEIIPILLDYSDSAIIHISPVIDDQVDCIAS